MRLEEDDVRQIVRLIGEVAALQGGHAEKKRALMSGLCTLVDADSWAWGLAVERNPEKPQIYASVLQGGFSDQGFARFLEAVEHPAMISITSAFFREVAAKNAHLTRLKDQIVDEREFAKTEAYPIWKEADVGSLIMSIRPLDAKSGSTIGLYRQFGRPRFTTRESRMAHIILTEVPWLHEQGWPEDRGARMLALSRRQRMALNLLVLGRPHKQIASEMNISLHTLQGYSKELYRYFHVNSQAELMNRFFQGNGLDSK